MPKRVVVVAVPSDAVITTSTGPRLAVAGVPEKVRVVALKVSHDGRDGAAAELGRTGERLRRNAGQAVVRIDELAGARTERKRRADRRRLVGDQRSQDRRVVDVGHVDREVAD